MKPDKWMAFEWPVFQQATTLMAERHKWRYLHAICTYYWDDCKGIPNVESKMMAACGTSDMTDWALTRGEIFGPKFKLEGEMWHQDVAREKYLKASEHMEMFHERAKTAADKRWEEHRKCSSNACSNAISTSQEMPRLCTGTGNCIDEEGIDKGSVIEAIYQAYPYKVGKRTALKEIERAITRGNSPEKLLEKTQLFAQARHGDTQYCPHPSTWFHQDRFNDDPETWKPKTVAEKPMTVFEINKIIDAKKAIAEGLKNKHCSEGPMGNEWQDKAAKEQHKKLRSEITALNMKLAGMA